MQQDEILEMARQSGLSIENPQYGYTERHHVAGWVTDLEAFAKLVEERTAAKERADEREACAKVCEEVGEHPSLTPLHCVESIRARGQT